MKNYKRKRHLINNTRDSERCNDIRKSLNSSERQAAKREIQEALQPNSYWDDYYRYYDEYDEWKHYTPLAMYTTGGKFITTLMRLGVLEGGDPTARPRTMSYHPYYELLEKLSTNDDGLI